MLQNLKVTFPLSGPLVSTPPEKKLITHTMHVCAPVRKYLEAWAPEVYEAKKDEMLGMWLINSLTRKSKQVKCYIREKDIARWGPVDAKRFGYMETWRFAIPKRYQDCTVMPRRRVVQFNNMIMKFIWAEIFTCMERKRVDGEVFYIANVIYAFREKYAMNDNEFPDERIRKAYLRYRNVKGIRNEYAEFLAGGILKY